MASSENLRILIAEDEDPFRLVIKNTLVSEGFSVEDCDSGEQAVEHLKQGSFDVVLLDYRMPGLTGLNVLQWMHEQKKDTPVIMLTAAGSEIVAVEAMKLGAYDYIRKEHIEISHLPIILRGVHERYLFKRDKELRLQLMRDRERDMMAFAIFHNTIESLSHIVNNTLTLLSLNIEEQCQVLIPSLKEEDRPRFTAACADMVQQYNLVGMSVKSLLTLSGTMKQGLESTTDPALMERIAQENVQNLERVHDKLMESGSA
jgi:DNA-binding NtrC family response regulator